MSLRAVSLWTFSVVLLSFFCSQPLSALVKHKTSLSQTLQADFDQPSDIAFSSDGRIYVLDGKQNRIVMLSKTGKRLSSFGRGVLNSPMAIAVYNKAIYVADSANHRIAVFDESGGFVEQISLHQQALADKLPEPVGLTLDDGVLTWSDRQNHQLCQIRLQDHQASRCWGKRGSVERQFEFPFHIASDRDGYIHVVDVLNGRIQVFNHKGGPFMTLSRFGINAGELYRPNGIAVADDGRLFVSDSYLGTISVFLKGRFSGLFSADGMKPMQFRVPVGLGWRDGKLYVVDARENSVLVFNSPASDTGLMMPKQGKDTKEAISKKDCTICHFSWIKGAEPGAMQQDGVLPVASQNMCYSCHHGAVIDSRQAIGSAAQHPDIHHPQQQKSGKPKHEDKIPHEFPLLNDKLSCGSCHTPHSSDIDASGTQHAKNENPWFRLSNHEGVLCQQCHESKLDSAVEREHPPTGHNHPIHIRLQKSTNHANPLYTRNEDLQHGLPKALVEAGGELGSNNQLLCQSCHQVHGAKDQNLLLRAYDENALCEACHQQQQANDEEEARRKGVHPVNINLEKPVKLGGEEVSHMVCASCHAVHDGKTDTALLREESVNGELCSACHEGYDALVNSDHDLRASAEDSENRLKQSPQQSGACGTCHSMHRAAPGQLALLVHRQRPEQDRSHSDFASDRVCLDCHHENGLAKDAVVEHYSHPSKDLVLRSDPKLMPLLDAQGKESEFGAIACITCHEPHHWQPQNAPPQDLLHAENRSGNVFNSFLRRTPGEIADSFCVDCHGIETRIKYKYYHDSRSRDIGADYIR